jgi:hypothetical protein
MEELNHIKNQQLKYYHQELIMVVIRMLALVMKREERIN